MKAIKSSLLIILMLTVTVLFVSCNETGEDNLWDSAIYLEDTALGEGATTFTLEVTAAEKTVVFTISTDEAILGDALLDLGLVVGEVGQFGLYMDAVNGIVADYNANQSYWAFYIDGEYAMTGVDGAEIAEGVVYKLAYTID